MSTTQSIQDGEVKLGTPRVLQPDGSLTRAWLAFTQFSGLAHETIRDQAFVEVYIARYADGTADPPREDLHITRQGDWNVRSPSGAGSSRSDANRSSWRGAGNICSD